MVNPDDDSNDEDWLASTHEEGHDDEIEATDSNDEDEGVPTDEEDGCELSDATLEDVHLDSSDAED